MSILSWQIRRNLETSLKEFLDDAISTQSLTVTDNCGSEVTPQVNIGFAPCDDWNLPVISVYVDSVLAPRACIGSNCRQEEFLLIIDIRALDSGMQADLTDWINTTINDGWTYFDYQPNGTATPTKTQSGYVSFNYISNLPIRLGDNADLFDKFRQNITIQCFVNLSV